MPGVLMAMLGFLNPYRWLLAAVLVSAVVGTGYVQHLRLEAARAEAKAATQAAAAAEASAQATREALDKYTAQVEDLARRQEAAGRVRTKTQKEAAAVMTKRLSDSEALALAKAHAAAISAQWSADSESPDAQ